MDRQAAKEYHAALWQRLKSRRRSKADFVWWVGLTGTTAYFAFGTYQGAIFGAVIGWAVTAILCSIDDLHREISAVEMLRHLHEHTDEAEDGKRLAEIHDAARKVSSRWWRA